MPTYVLTVPDWGGPAFEAMATEEGWPFDVVSGDIDLASRSALERFVRRAASVFEVDYRRLVSKSRRHRLVMARSAATLVAHDEGMYSFKDLGAFFSARDHSTMVVAAQRAREEAEINSAYAHRLARLRIAYRMEHQQTNGQGI